MRRLLRRDWMEPPKNRFLRGIYLLIQRFLRHNVGMQGAALAFYLLFMIFPLLIFVSSLLGLLQLDVDAILAENTETYERMDQYLDYARKYSQGNYQVEGSYLLTSAPGEMESGAEIINTIGGDYNLISSQTAMQFAMDMSIGGTIMGAPIAPTDMNLDMRADLDTGMLYLYFQSEDLEQLMNNNVQVNGESV